MEAVRSVEDMSGSELLDHVDDLATTQRRCEVEILKAAVQHAKSRVQFQQPIAEFELVKKKLAFMAAHTFAMEAATRQCAAFIDRGAEDYMLETAILKVFATEHLWTIVNDTIQIFGGKAYFTDEPYERLMRDVFQAHALADTVGADEHTVVAGLKFHGPLPAHSRACRGLHGSGG